MDLGVAALNLAHHITPGMMLSQKLMAGLEDLVMRRTILAVERYLWRRLGLGFAHLRILPAFTRCLIMSETIEHANTDTQHGSHWHHEFKALGTASKDQARWLLETLQESRPSAPGLQSRPIDVAIPLAVS